MELILASAAAVLIAVALGWFLWRRRIVDEDVPLTAKEALLNGEEKIFYDAVRRALTPGFEIFAKVGLADVVKLSPGLSASRSRRARERLRAEHLDFVVCRPDNSEILGVIELGSDKAGAEERKFFDAVLARTGLPVLQVEKKTRYDAAILREQALATFHPQSQAASIRTMVRRGTVWLRIDGHGNFQNSAAVRAFTERMIDEGHRSFAFDLHVCGMMDSTFLGTLTGLALRLREEPNGRLGFARVNPGIELLFGRYGLDRVLAFQGFEAAPPAPEEMEELALAVSAEYKRGTLLEAHEALAASSPENAERFGEVVDFLKRKEPGNG